MWFLCFRAATSVDEGEFMYFSQRDENLVNIVQDYGIARFGSNNSNEDQNSDLEDVRVKVREIFKQENEFMSEDEVK